MKGPGLVLVLSMLFISALLGPALPYARAVSQNGLTTWSPYGPRTNKLTLATFSDSISEYNALFSGQIDITDFPIPRATCLGCLVPPDVFLSPPQPDLALFDIEVNHHAPFLGLAQQAPRTVTAAGLLSSPSTVPGCSVGFGRLIVNLFNLEEGNTPIRDPLNSLTAVGSQTFTVSDPGATGTYTVPGSTTCMLAGTYTISTRVYSGSAKVFVGSGQVVTVKFGVNYNSPSTVKETAAGVEIRRAISHLLDKPSFVQNDFSLRTTIGSSPQGVYNDVESSPAQGLSAPSQSVLNEECSEHSWLNPCAPVSAYNLQSDLIYPSQLWWAGPGGSAGVTAGYSGVNDLRAACDHFVAAGFTIVPSTATCLDVANASVGTTPLSSYPHLDNNGQHLILFLRTHLPRRHYGQIIADSLNFLFGTPNNGGTIQYGCAPNFFFSCAFNTVFDTTVPDDWNLYVGGFTSMELYQRFHSSFASSFCGGATAQFANNYNFYCSPAFDGESSAGEFAASSSEQSRFFQEAAITAHRTVMTVPVFSPLIQFEALNGWNFQATGTPTRSSLVSALGTGFYAGSPGGFWSLLNMRQVPGYVANSGFQPGGGDPNLIRRGLSQPINNPSPFFAYTLSDFDVVNQVYDTMLQVNPLTGGTFAGVVLSQANEQVIDWMTTSHSSSFDPAEVSCLGASCVNGTTTQLWHLRNDLRFHDGIQVTADDVVFSILAYRDIGTAVFDVTRVASAVGLNPTTVQVKIQLQNPLYELDVGSLPILPKHLWASHCGTPIGAPGNDCANPSFDPMATGIYTGSGPWVCRSLDTGTAGGSCITPCPPNIVCTPADLKIILSAYDGYMRGRPGVLNSSLHKLSWADKDNDGVVNILDVADAALHFGQPDPYWNTGQNPQAPNVGTDPNVVDIGEIATVAFYFDHGTTAPFLPSQLTGLDPCIDPFFQVSPPC